MMSHSLMKYVLGCIAGIVIGFGMAAFMSDKNTGSAMDKKTERKPLYWVAPMDPSYRSDKPGKSPMGMDLIPVYEEDAQASGIKIDPIEAHNLALTTAKVAKRPLTLTARAVGRVGYDEDLRVHIHTRVNGWIETLFVKAEGDRVVKGQPLFSLYSPEWVNAQQEYLTALQSQDPSLIQASKDRLGYLGLTSQQILMLKKTRQVQDRLIVRAPQSGYLEAITIGEGEFVTPKTKVMSLVDLKRVWVIVDIFERDASLIEIGMPVSVKVEAYPAKEWTGRVAHIYPALHPRSRTLPIRIVIDNDDERLRVGMLAKAELSKTVGERVVIPKSALIRGRINRVVKRVDDTHFDVAVVEPGLETDTDVEILSGLVPGDVVVTSSQFLIDSESNLDEALKRFQMQKETNQSVFGQGIVKAVDLKNKKITVAHEPIEKLGWPAMTMPFAVSEEISLSEALVGANVHFRLIKQGDAYLIDQMHVMQHSDSAVQPQHDAQEMDHEHHEHGGHHHD